MKLERRQMLRGMYGRDRALDGRYLTAVQTTRIYCLPSCPARKPRPEHVLFFLTPEAARAAGFRACKRCRPDLFHRGARSRHGRLRRAAAAHARRPAALRVGARARGSVGIRRDEADGAHARALSRDARAAAAPGARRARVRAARGGRGSRRARSASPWASRASRRTTRNFRRATGMSPGDYRGAAGGRRDDPRAAARLQRGIRDCASRDATS